MTPPPPAGRGIIIRGCRCALLGSPLGSQPLNKSNSVARDVSHAPSPLPIPSPRLEVSARRNRRNLLPPLCSSVALSIEMLLHRDFKEIDKEDAIHLVFLRQSAGEEGGEGQGMTRIHGREEWEEVGIGEGRGEGGLEKLGDGGGYKEPRG